MLQRDDNGLEEDFVGNAKELDFFFSNKDNSVININKFHKYTQSEFYMIYPQSFSWINNFNKSYLQTSITVNQICHKLYFLC